MKDIRSAEQLASQHYENFPVALWILPKAWRKTIRLIYAFARQADDMADEGNLPVEERLSHLNAFSDQLCIIQQDMKTPTDTTALSPFFQALYASIKTHHLPLAPFFDLLTAFKQDVVKSSYANWDELLEYCAHSANPIGALLLALAQQNTAENLAASNAICSALQLLNFWQDVVDDQQQRARCYIPLDAQQQHGFTKASDLSDRQYADAYRNLIQNQLDKTGQLLDSGAELPNRLSGVFGFQIRMVLTCAYRVLSRLYRRDDYYQRPILKTSDWAIIVCTTGYKTLIHWCKQKNPFKRLKQAPCP
jgi:squalene synthase HpnC